MANLQTNFRKFNDTIKLDWDTDLEKLRVRRDRVLDRLTEGLERQREAGADIPAFKTRMQGSYAMGTGIQPLDGDYDIDVALTFEFELGKLPEPLTVKSWVYEAVKQHTQKVEFRGPCITVFYTEGGEPAYHVDLAVHAEVGGKLYLARGKQHSADPSWDASDPEALVKLVKEWHSNATEGATEREQLRRVIRYLKRWKDVCFSSQGESAPRGIALTICAVQWLEPRVIDRISRAHSEDDLAALTNLVKRMRTEFAGPRPVLALPVPPYDDVLRRMTDEQLRNVSLQLDKLHATLDAAKREPDARKAAELLVGKLGSDFPLEGGRSTPPIVGAVLGTSGASA
jgi:hypothetical protein